MMTLDDAAEVAEIPEPSRYNRWPPEHFIACEDVIRAFRGKPPAHMAPMTWPSRWAWEDAAKMILSEQGFDMERKYELQESICFWGWYLVKREPSA